MSEPRYPFGYGDTMLTMAEYEEKTTVENLYPEVWRRFKALMEYAHSHGVPLGVGDAWRVQPDPPPPGFAQPGNSWHESCPTSPTSATALAIDTVPSSSWDWMELHCHDYGLRSFRNVNDEPWHVQPVEAPTARSYATTLPPIAVWPLPGDTPEPVPPLEEDDDMPAPIVLKAADPTDETNPLFWWDGKSIGWIRTTPALNVGRLTGLYRFHESGEPFTNWTRAQIQREINTSWAGGPVPEPVHPAVRHLRRLGGRMMLAEIVSGERDIADVLFLIAAILAGIVAFMRWPEQQMTGTLSWAAVSLLAVGFLLL